jgi:hypothetical protein
MRLRWSMVVVVLSLGAPALAKPPVSSGWGSAGKVLWPDPAAGVVNAP